MSILSSTRVGASSMKITAKYLHETHWHLKHNNKDHTLDDVWMCDRKHYIYTDYWNKEVFITSIKHSDSTITKIKLSSVQGLNILKKYWASTGRHRRYYYKKIIETVRQKGSL